MLHSRLMALAFNFRLMEEEEVRIRSAEGFLTEEGEGCQHHRLDSDQKDPVASAGGRSQRCVKQNLDSSKSSIKTLTFILSQLAVRDAGSVSEGRPSSR